MKTIDANYILAHIAFTEIQNKTTDLKKITYSLYVHHPHAETNLMYPFIISVPLPCSI